MSFMLFRVPSLSFSSLCRCSPIVIDTLQDGKLLQRKSGAHTRFQFCSVHTFHSQYWCVLVHYNVIHHPIVWRLVQICDAVRGRWSWCSAIREYHKRKTYNICSGSRASPVDVNRSTNDIVRALTHNHNVEVRTPNSRRHRRRHRSLDLERHNVVGLPH